VHAYHRETAALARLKDLTLFTRVLDAS